MSGRVLIVDDDPGFSRALARALRRSGHDVVLCERGAEARTQLEQVDPDVVVLDFHLPDADGLQLLEELRPLSSGASFVMATAYPSVDVAVEAMRRGAFDYVAKDAEAEECRLRIERAMSLALLRRRMAAVAREEAGGEDYGLLGESRAMKALREQLRTAASSGDTTVLLVGETGTGKGVAARAIHAMSERAYEPLVAVDCTTIPATLVESELFGHEKGAFSGAVRAKPGRVEVAGKGTLFLDEVGELDLSVQAKLLRLLEEREYTRVGGTRSRRLEARIVTATNRDLERAVAEGRFRADLRYRLEVFVVRVPPLRERGDDVFLLAARFASERARALGRPEPRLHPEVIHWLPRYPFPGNVRELRNMIEQAVLLAKGDEITLDELPVLGRLAQGWEPPRPGPGGHRAAGSVPPSGEPWPEARTAPMAALGAWSDGPPAPTIEGAGGRATVEPQAPPAREASRPPFGPRSEAVGPSAHPAPPDPGWASVHAAGTSGELSGRDPLLPVPPEEPLSLEQIRAQARAEERRRLLEALRASGGNVSAAARMLGLSRYQVLRRLRRYGLR